jgi:hypothetical protein
MTYREAAAQDFKQRANPGSFAPIGCLRRVLYGTREWGVVCESRKMVGLCRFGFVVSPFFR